MTVAVNTPPLTLEEVAESVGLSRNRAKELAALASKLTGKKVTVYTSTPGIKAAKRSHRVGLRTVRAKKAAK
jgi:hypothetical protein